LGIHVSCEASHSWVECHLLPCTTPLYSPGTGASVRFFHTVCQSVFGHNVAILISRGSISILLMWWSVSYTRRLYIIMDSVGPLSATYAESTAKGLRHSIVAGIRFRNGVFWLSPVSPHFRSHSAVTVPGLVLCMRILLRKRAWLFAVKCLSSQPPPSFLLSSVDSGTRNISPLHKNQAIVVFSCLTYTFGGGISAPCTKPVPRGGHARVVSSCPSSDSCSRLPGHVLVSASWSVSNS
jgi:hypothetical protein